VLITSGGIQSNHCRATAFVAAQLGLKCHLILRGKPPTPIDGNLLLDDLLGATVDYVSATEFAELDLCYQRAAEKFESQGETPYCIPVGASNEIGIWGYVEAAKELKKDIQKAGIQSTSIITAVGSGGTFAGLAAGLSEQTPHARLIGICVAHDRKYFQQKINEDLTAWQYRYQQLPSTISHELLDDFIGKGYGIASQEVYELIKTVATFEGIILDPVYTAKAMLGLSQLIHRKEIVDKDVIFIHTGGIFGLFPNQGF
jgi:D-cysteine desulfhydrase